jgi:hypothetical protein
VGGPTRFESLFGVCLSSNSQRPRRLFSATSAVKGLIPLRPETLNRIYETVGCVKCFLRTLQRALGTRAPFRSLGKAFVIVNPRLAANRSVGTFRFDLNIYPIDFDHDYYFKLPSREGSGVPESEDRCSTSHHAVRRATPRANRTGARPADLRLCATASTNSRPTCAPWQRWRCCVDAAWPGA